MFVSVAPEAKGAMLSMVWQMQENMLQAVTVEYVNLANIK